VTEGKTDIFYLRIAMKALRANFQRLVNTDDDRTELSVRFLNSSTVNQKVLDLGTGTGGMVKVISAYDKNWLKHYRFKPLVHPVIFVVDNDDGGKNVLSAANKASKQKIDPASTEPFCHIHRNLYLVRTPLGPSGERSAIEDCLPGEVRRQWIDGKRFDPNKKHGDETSLGKQKFAELIVRPGVKTIDFSGFAPILDGVSRAIVDYETRSKEAARQAPAKSA
jgi:RNA-directed DNA polymerase